MVFRDHSTLYILTVNKLIWLLFLIVGEKLEYFPSYSQGWVTSNDCVAYTCVYVRIKFQVSSIVLTTKGEFYLSSRRKTNPLNAHANQG